MTKEKSEAHRCLQKLSYIFRNTYMFIRPRIYKKRLPV